jgi:uncharacterized protein (TIGR02996 family)
VSEDHVKGIEEAFVRDVVANPEDESAKLIYADWLEDQGTEEGRARAEYLRTLVALAALPKRGRKRAQRERLGRLRPAAGAGWVAALARVPVENCPVRFAFRCPRKWENLTPTEDPAVRFCGGCQKSVHYCGTLAEARQHARAGHCVAVDLGVPRSRGDLVRRPGLRTLGRVRPW